MVDYDLLRERMVQQLISEGIRDNLVIEAMRAVPRHLFVDDKFRSRAYDDHALPIGHDQTISQPYIVAKMTELLELTPQDRVLEVGTGSGYQAAILAKIASQVYSVERIPELADAARRLLQDLGYTNVSIKVSDGTCGWEEEAPFDAILVTACAPKIPQPLIDQLSVGGRLVIPVGNEQLQRLQRLRKEGIGYKVEDHGGCVFVRLVGRYGWAN